MQPPKIIQIKNLFYTFIVIILAIKKLSTVILTSFAKDAQRKKIKFLLQKLLLTVLIYSVKSNPINSCCIKKFSLFQLDKTNSTYFVFPGYISSVCLAKSSSYWSEIRTTSFKSKALTVELA